MLILKRMKIARRQDMGEIAGICSVCGGLAMPAFTCRLCGALCCSKCFVRGKDVCRECAVKL